jgi:hypothetical protein
MDAQILERRFNAMGARVKVRQARPRWDDRLREGLRVPRLDVRTDNKGEYFDLVLRNEPLSRGRGSKPHNMEFCYRIGGETMYVNHKYPSGISQDAYNRLDPAERKRGWQVMRRDAGVYARGRISHADHATIVLDCWHRVEMNTEREAAAMRHVAFLD